jgi:two-component system, sensor histidine kinase and response regulator
MGRTLASNTKGATMTEQRDGAPQVAVNLSELLVRVDNDHDLLCELIEIFKEEFPRLLEELRQAVAREEVKNVETTSHALKGMLLGLSVTRGAELVARLEQMAREGKTAGFADALTDFEGEVEGLLAELDGYTAETEL